MSSTSKTIETYLHCHLRSDETLCDQLGGNLDSSDILVTISNTPVLKWYGSAGLKLIREYSLPVCPTDRTRCLFCSFTMGPSITPDQILQRAIAVLLDDFHLQIYLHSGESFYINLPVSMSDMVALPIGLLFKKSVKAFSDMTSSDADKTSDPLDFDTNFKNLIQSKLSDNNLFGVNDSNSSYFSLTNPSAAVLPVFKVNSDKNFMRNGEEEEKLMCIHQNRNIVCIYKPKKKSFVLYEIKPLYSTTSAVKDNKTDSSIVDTSQFIHHNISIELDNIPEFDHGIIPQRSSPSPHMIFDPIMSMTHNLGSNSNGSINNINKGFIPISNTSRRFRQSPTLGGTPPIGNSSPSLLMFGSGNSNNSNNSSNIRNSEALQSFLGFHPPKGPREKEKSLRNYQLNSNNINNNLFVTSLSSNNNINIGSNSSALNSTSSSNLFDKRIDQNKQIINSALPYHFTEFTLVSVAKEISLESYFKNDEIDSPDNIKVTFSGDFNSLGGLIIHFHLPISKRYFSYVLKTSSIKNTNLILYSQLKYSNHPIALEELNNKKVVKINSNDIVNVIHVKIPIDHNKHNKIYQLGSIRDSVTNTINTSSLSLTLLVEMNQDKEQKISILLAGSIIKEIYVVQITDDLSIDGTTTSLAFKNNSLLFHSIYSHCGYFCIEQENCQSILSLPSLLGSDIAYSFVGSAHDEIMDVIKSAICNFILLDLEVIAIEIVEVLMACSGEEIDWSIFLVCLITSSYGICIQDFSSYDSKISKFLSKINNIYNSFEKLRKTCVDYFNGKFNSTQFGYTLFNLCHNILQDYLLRFNNNINNFSVKRLRDSLSLAYKIIIQSMSSEITSNKNIILIDVRISLKNQIVSSFGIFYGDDGCNNNLDNSRNRKAIDSVEVYQSLLKYLSDRNAIKNISDKILKQTSYYLCVTLKLTVLFFTFLSNHHKDDFSWSRKIIDAVVYTLYGEFNSKNSNGLDQKEYDWLSSIQFFPYMIRIIIELAVNQCRFDPNRDWPDHVLKVIGRNDLCRNDMNLPDFNISSSFAKISNGSNETSINEPEIASDGLLEVENSSYLRFTEDDRLHEVCRLLCSSKTIYLKVEKAPEISELDHRHKLQMKLLVLCRRTLACSIGRGMLTMSSLEPLMAEALPIPPISLSGRVPPNNSIINLDTSTAPTDLTLWPEYNNGVAAALRIGPSVKSTKSKKGSNRVTRNWIIYNKTACIVKPGGESSHAGFLLGLGLQGHLTVLSVTDICDYLTQGNDPTTVSVLIGCAASKIGSADPLLSKTLCLHLPALLPSQHWDIEISPLVQSAALVGLGLLHCGSGHRLMTEFLLSELVRMPSSSSSESSESREAIALSASWALGMVLLGKGSKRNSNRESSSSLQGLVDLRIEDRLEQFMNGGKKPSESSLFPSFSSATFIDASSKSSKILEGDVINTDVTSPGATIALAMIYIRSNNTDILNRLSLPNTVIVLDSIRPDILIYRALGRCLVMWDEVIPSDEWIDSQIPSAILNSLFSKTDDHTNIFPNKTLNKLSQRSAFPLYVSAIAGFCYGIGIIFAGSSDEVAMNTLLRKLKILQSFRDNKPLLKLGFVVDKSMRHVVEMCVCVVSLSLSCVMAGSGNLDCLRIFRELRWKVDDISYGSHLSISMAIGMLFLAGGKYSLKRDPISTACLLLSICPRYPSRTIDNQYHLQALRHMYVLATENRALHTIDVDTGSPVNLNVDVLLLDGSRKVIKAPGLLPELSTIREIKVNNYTNQMREASPNNTDVSSNSDYYPTSLVIIKTESEESVGINGIKGISQKFSQIIVPPLLVKRITPSLATNDNNNKKVLSDTDYQNNIIAKLFSQKSLNSSIVSLVKQHRIEDLLSILVDSKDLDDNNNNKNNSDFKDNIVVGGSLVLDSYPLTKVIVEALIES